MSLSPPCPLCKKPMEWDGEVYHCRNHIRRVWFSGTQGLRITEEELERERNADIKREAADEKRRRRAARLAGQIPVVEEP